VAWTFVRPADASVLDGRPLLDVGTGDAQTLLALTDPDGVRIGIDRSSGALGVARRSGLRDVVAASAAELPFTSGSFRTILAGDVFHHLADGELGVVLDEVRRVCVRGAVLVAWWYEASGRGGLGDPAFPRTFDRVAARVREAGFALTSSLELVTALEPSPPTVGLRAEA
jgi:hypothetical protein